MGISLQNLFSNTNISPVSGNPSVDSTVAGSAADVSKLTAGTQISGQVISNEDGVITVQMQDNSVFSAKLAANIPLTEGSQITFRVSSTQNNQIILSPLFTNTNAVNTATLALNQAGIAVNGETLSMANTMMQEGMGIDKNSLLQMHHMLGEHPSVPAETIVKMNALSIPVTEENAQWFQNYENTNHQMLGAIEEVSASATKTLMELVNGLKEGLGQTGEASITVNSLWNFQGGDLEQKGVLEQSGSRNNLENLEQSGLLSKSESLEQPDLLSKPENPEQSGLLSRPENLEQNTVQQKNEVFMKLVDDLTKIFTGEQQESKQQLTATTQMNQIFSQAEQNSLARIFNHAGIEEAAVTQIKNGTYPLEKLMSLFSHMSKTNLNAFEGILERGMFQKTLSALSARQWLMTPESVADKRSVEQFYEQIRSQTGKLSETLSNAGLKDSALFQTVSHMSENIDFMNQLNQTFSYVQLPLKMTGQNAHGDLYVYSNKKNMASADGSISAFVHLDMEHLGPVDVMVNMQAERILTDFRVSSDEVLDLVEQNTGLLNKRLEEKGYHMEMKASVSKEPVRITEEMQKEQHSLNMPLSHQSFEARA